MEVLEEAPYGATGGFSGGNSLVGRQNTEEGSQPMFMGEQGESARVELVKKDIDGRMDHCCSPLHPCVLLTSDFGLCQYGYNAVDTHECYYLQ